MHSTKVVRTIKQIPLAKQVIQPAMVVRFTFLQFAALCLSSCSTLIYKTGWQPKQGADRASIVAKLGEPVTSKKRNDLPRDVGLWPSMVTLKDFQGREDRYVSYRMIRNEPNSYAALVFDSHTYGAGELLMFPYAVVDHWFPRRRVLAIYYDRQDLLQGYYLDPPEPRR